MGWYNSVKVRKREEEEMYKILICDDQPDIVNALKIYLAPEGYELYEAKNGAQAVEMVKDQLSAVAALYE